MDKLTRPTSSCRPHNKYYLPFFFLGPSLEVWFAGFFALAIVDSVIYVGKSLQPLFSISAEKVYSPEHFFKNIFYTASPKYLSILTRSAKVGSP